jgi:phage/plasmid-associated DNA primase
MPVKSHSKTKLNSKAGTKSNRKRADSEDDDRSSIAASDMNSEVDPVEAEVAYKIHSTQSIQLRELEDFLADPKMINASGDPTTNIVNRQTYKCYNISDKKIPKFFKLLEACRKANIRMMMNELQQEYSGIMLDFDIYQDNEEDQLTDEIFYVLCQKVVELLIKIINFNEKKVKLYIGITRRPKITFCEANDCYKDGFHMLIPSIKVTKGVKKLLLNKLLENEIIDKVLADVTPANMKTKSGSAYQRRDFLDLNSATVPVFYIGSSTKKGHASYSLSNIYEVTYSFDTKSLMIDRNTTLQNSRSFNLCYEFSLNYEVSNGNISKKKYEPTEKYINEVIEISSNTSIEAEEINKNFGILSMNSIHDAQIKELKDVLDVLHPKRADNYSLWLNVLFVLAGTSPSYKGLAEYFSRKSTKFNMAKFEQTWLQALKGTNGKKALNLGSLYYWAKLDNPERANELRKQSVYNVLYNMVYEDYSEGILPHSDVADILYRLLRYKYVTDYPEGEKSRVWYEFILEDDEHIPGELYKWRRWQNQYPVSLNRYISETLPSLFSLVLKRVKDNYENSSGNISKYYSSIVKNFKKSIRNLKDRNFKKNVIAEAEDRFNKIGFADSLDKDPLIRGVSNGVLKLSTSAGGKPVLIQGHHSYPVSKYTDVPYIAFNPYDELTKEILLTLRTLFPDNEPDTFEFMMYYFSSTIDGNPKESMFMMLVGKGSNGKTFLVELHKSTIGSIYGVKLPLSYLTQKSTSADTATPAQMMLKDASLAYYSESNRYEILNAARVKEVTGLETIAGRKLNQNMINFKPKCHHLATTNYDFDIECNDHGTWRRIEYVPLKITFIDPAVTKLDPADPNQRIANDKVTQEWTESPEVRGRYLGFMVWMHYWLYRKYNGKVKRVPHKHVQFETNKYRTRQDTISAFLTQRLVKVTDETEQYSMNEEVQKYVKWYSLNHGGIIPAKGVSEQFQNSPIGGMIKNTSRGLFLIGHRFLDTGEKLEEGEEYAMKNIFDMEIPADNFGIANETPEQFYKKICSEYDESKAIFTDSGESTVDIATMPERLWADDDCEADDSNIKSLIEKNTVVERSDNLEYNGRILPSGIVLKVLEEPTNIHNDDCGDADDLVGYLPYDEDSEFEDN